MRMTEEEYAALTGKTEQKRKSKYHNQATEIDGIEFDSKKEARRYQELKQLERVGQITKLDRQVKYELIPSQKINGKVVERPCDYYADFVYIENGNKVVEDCKGQRTKEYIIKRKLMLAIHHIKIRET